MYILWTTGEGTSLLCAGILGYVGVRQQIGYWRITFVNFHLLPLRIINMENLPLPMV